MLKRIRRFFAGLFNRIRNRRKPTYSVQWSDDMPKALRPMIIYLVGEKGYEWAAALLCPCGCGDVIQLNLLVDSSRPTWTVLREKNGNATIIPSVWRNSGCKSHFIIREGGLRWCY